MTSRPAIAALLCAFALPLARAQQTTLPLWPTATPEPAQTAEPEADIATPQMKLLPDGHRPVRLTNITRPTMSVYPPRSHANGTAAIVFPGGGYRLLAWDLEGLDTCHWLNSIGVTCLLVKYRVPEAGYYPENPADLEDAQQAMRLARAHAEAWRIDPNRIGVVGYSAGGNLAVLLSTHPDDRHVESTPAASEVDASIDARPNFAIVVYPAYLAIEPAMTELNPVYTPTHFTPPTFLIQAEDDTHYGKNAPLYYQVLAAANVPAELHMYPTGGHGFGVDPPGKPEDHWTRLADTWLRSIHMLPPLPLDTAAPANLSPTPSGPPCPLGPPNAESPHPSATSSANGPCTSPDFPH